MSARRRRDDRGAVVLMVALLSVVLFGAVAAAKRFTLGNFGITEADWAGCQDPARLDHQAPGTQCISFDDPVAPAVVRVVAPLREVDFAFAPLLGVSGTTVAAAAQAELQRDFEADCGLCVVGEGYHDLQNGDAHIADGNVVVNGVT